MLTSYLKEKTIATRQLPPGVAVASYGASGVTVIGSSGNKVTLTPARVLAHKALLKGPRDGTVDRALERWAATVISDTLGWSVMDPSRVVIAFGVDGIATKLNLLPVAGGA